MMAHDCYNDGISRTLIGLIPLIIGILSYKVEITGSSHKEWEIHEYCENEDFDIDCGEGSIIVVNYAHYGRMREGHCITNNYGKIGCERNVKGLLDKFCSGRSKCTVGVSSFVPENLQPCPKDFRSYLEANHTCVSVMSGSPNLCKGPSHIRIRNKSGYLSSYITEMTDLGSLDCPWLIEVDPGQTITIALFDFGWETNIIEHVCHVYAIIKETAVSNSKTICAGKETERIVYTSTTNIVEVRLVVKKNVQSKFLLHYAALGCGDVPTPFGGIAKRYGSKVTLTCPDTAFTWTLVCVGNEWVGNKYNCSHDSILRGSVHDGSNFSINSGLSIIVIVLIAIAIGISILVFGLICLKRRTRSNPNTSSTHPPPYEDYFQSKVVEMKAEMYGNQKSLNNSYAINDADLRYYQQQRHLQEMYQPPYNAPVIAPMRHNSNNDDQYNIDAQDHIYESPTFAHKNVTNSSCFTEDTPSVMYYDVDPSLQMESFNRTLHNQNMNKNMPHPKYPLC